MILYYGPPIWESNWLVDFFCLQHYSFAILLRNFYWNQSSIKKYIQLSRFYNVLGIRGAKGASLPRLCFAQLAFSFKWSITWHTHTHTYTHTDTHNYINRCKKIWVFSHENLNLVWYIFSWTLKWILQGHRKGRTKTTGVLCNL